jgi:hypothetical protein
MRIQEGMDPSRCAEPRTHRVACAVLKTTAIDAVAFLNLVCPKLTQCLRPAARDGRLCDQRSVVVVWGNPPSVRKLNSGLFSEDTFSSLESRMCGIFRMHKAGRWRSEQLEHQRLLAECGRSHPHLTNGECRSHVCCLCYSLRSVELHRGKGVAWSVGRIQVLHV